MAQLFVTLRGGFGTLAGSGRNEQGEDLEWPAWHDIRLVSSEHSEESHPFAADLVGASTDPGEGQ